MKFALIKDNIRTILKNIKRYFVIILIVFLGSSIFCAFNCVVPDFKNSLNNYYDTYNFMDLKIMSSYGMTDDDINLIKTVDGITEVMPSITSDIELKYNNNNYTLTLHSLSNDATVNGSYINKLDLVNGSLPNYKNECVIENELAKRLNITIGTVITIDELDSSMSSDLLKYNQYTVVGLTDSPMYTNKNQYKLTGENYGYIYVPMQSLNYSAYTECFATIKDTQKCFYKKYNDIIENYQDSILQKLEDNIDYNYYNNLKQYNSSVEIPKYFVTTRNENLSFRSISQDIDILSNLATTLPLIFFLVASLVSLTSTSRLVDETRAQIGIYKALGYNDKQVKKKYLLYSISACVVGSLLGIYVGSKYLAEVIINLYELANIIKSKSIDFHLLPSIIDLALSIFCVAFASISACNSAIQEYIYKLMRPKTPPIGKKIFLENLTFFWNKLNFMQKVTTRNLFRYKKRLIMTILGIVGCTSILIAGFSLFYEVTSIVDKQYSDVFKYDLELTLSSKNYSNNNYTELSDFLYNTNGTSEALFCTTKIINASSEKNEDGNSAKLIVLDNNNNINNFIGLYSSDKNETYNVPDTGIIISKKLAKLLKVTTGGKINISNFSTEIEIINITDNYYNNYIYMSKDYYSSLTSEIYSDNTIFINLSEEDRNNSDEIIKEYTKNSMIQQVSDVASIISASSESMNSVRKIMILLILCSGLLAFAVLYNLSILNISERLRELATLKVLGFREKEVVNYVAKENILLTIIGILFGMLAGFILTKYVFISCETEEYLFSNTIYIRAYLFSIALTFIFLFIVNKLSALALKKIDMIDSLKSVE